MTWIKEQLSTFQDRECSGKHAEQISDQTMATGSACSTEWTGGYLPVII